jgi:hypothetical protein
MQGENLTLAQNLPDGTSAEERFLTRFRRVRRTAESDY